MHKMTLALVWRFKIVSEAQYVTINFSFACCLAFTTVLHFKSATLIISPLSGPNGGTVTVGWVFRLSAAMDTFIWVAVGGVVMRIGFSYATAQTIVCCSSVTICEWVLCTTRLIMNGTHFLLIVMSPTKNMRCTNVWCRSRCWCQLWHVRLSYAWYFLKKNVNFHRTCRTSWTPA